MTQKELTNKLTLNFKSYIRSLKHVESGKLLNTIKVVPDGPNSFKVVGPDYMQYLDNGKFVDNFFALPDTIALIEQYIALDITLTLTKE